MDELRLLPINVKIPATATSRDAAEVVEKMQHRRKRADGARKCDGVAVLTAGNN
jgi:hypothetical protein